MDNWFAHQTTAEGNFVKNRQNQILKFHSGLIVAKIQLNRKNWPKYLIQLLYFRYLRFWAIYWVKGIDFVSADSNSSWIA